MNDINKRLQELVEERNARKNMTTGEILPEEQGRKDMIEKNKLFFFLMVKGLIEEYIEFCSFDKADWDAYFIDNTRV